MNNMKGKHLVTITFLTVLIVAAVISYTKFQSQQATESSPFLIVNGSDLILNGTTLRGEIGANHADLVWSFMNESYTKYDNGTKVIEDAGQYGIRALRFSATGLTTEFLELWHNNKTRFWECFDRMVATASANHVYLIPVLIWTTWNEDLGMFEPFHNFSRKIGILKSAEIDNKSQVFVPNSTANQMFKNFTRELITRYKDNPTILMWEIGNELNLVYGRAERYFNNITDLHDFLQDTTTFIRSIDPNHPIESGMAAPTIKVSSEDIPQGETLDEALGYFILFNLYVDIASIHTYKHYNTSDRDQCGEVYGISEEEYICLFWNISKTMKKPMIIGEFGEQGPENADSAPNNSKFIEEVINTTRKHGIPLALIWEWEVPNETLVGKERRRWNVGPEKTPHIINLIPELPPLTILPLLMVISIITITSAKKIRKGKQLTTCK